MRSHRLRFVRCAVAAGCGALLLVTALASATRAEEVSPVEWRPGTSEWDPVAVRQHGHALELAYRESCFERNYRATLKETRRSVTITVRDEGAVFAPGHVVSCPAPKEKSLVLRLDRPLAGRLIGGLSLAAEPRAAFGYVETESERVTVPDLIGFAPRDAELALDFGYLHGRVLLTNASAGLPRVVAQEPAAGHMMPRHSVVRLFVARQINGICGCAAGRAR